MESTLTVKEVANHLGSNEETVRIWLRSGRIRGVKPGGDKLGWRIPASELLRLLGKQPRAVDLR